MKLTQKQERFCHFVLKLNDASAAYRQAYNAEKMKPNVVHVRASELLKNSKVAVRLEELRAQVAEKTTFDEARVLEEVARIGLLDPARLFDAAGNLLEVPDMPVEVRAAIASIEVEQIFDGSGKERKHIGQLKKIKLWNKNEALEKLMKHLGCFERDNKQRAGIFDGVPHSTLQMIHDKLNALSGSSLAGQPGTGSASRFTH